MRDYDFGNYLPAELSGYKYRDKMADGSIDASDTGLAGWQIVLSGTAGDGSSVNMTATTDSNGFYEFTDLMPGDYNISEILQPGWTQSYPASGDYDVTLESGDSPETSYDFANWDPIDPSGVELRGHQR